MYNQNKCGVYLGFDNYCAVARRNFVRADGCCVVRRAAVLAADLGSQLQRDAASAQPPEPVSFVRAEGDKRYCELVSY